MKHLDRILLIVLTFTSLMAYAVDTDNDNLDDDWEIATVGNIDALDDFSLTFYHESNNQTWQDSYWVQGVVESATNALAGTLKNPRGTTLSFTIGSNNICKTSSQKYPYYQRESAGWVQGTYAFSIFKEDSSTLAFDVGVESIDYPYVYAYFSNYIYPYEDLETTQTVQISSSAGKEWTLLELYKDETNLVYSLGNTNTVATTNIVFGTEPALDYGTDYTIKVYAESGAIPKFVSTKSLFFSTKVKNEDNDSLDDEWEQLIVDANSSDSITSVVQVTWFDDFDKDGLSNAEEFAIQTDPTIVNTYKYNTLEEGLELLQTFVGEDGLRGHMSLAEKCIQSVVQSEPANYKARVCLSFFRLINLMNDVELDELIHQFGFSIDLAMNAIGEFDFINAPLSNQIMDNYGTNLLRALEASIADLETIPTNWTGTIQVTTNDIPVNETVYIDLADITYIKAAMTSMYAWLNMLKANNLDVDYLAALAPTNATYKTMTVDGKDTDWQSVSPSLIAQEEEYLIQSVSTARDADNLYVLINYSGIDLTSEDSLDIDARFNLSTNATFSFNYGLSSYNGKNTNSYFNIKGETVHASNTVLFITNDCIEVAIPLPESFEPAFFYPSECSTYRYYWGSSELSFPNDCPADDLLASQASLLSEIRDANLLQQAHTNWTDALDLLLLADELIEQRSDLLMHFIEYDPAESTDRQEVIERVTEVRNSFDAPVLLSTTNTPYNDLLEKDVFLGAYFTPDYLLRDMLPAFDTHLAHPVINSFPDYTFGGIFPDNTPSIFMRDYRMFNDDDAGLAGALDNYDLLWSTGGGWYDQWVTQSTNTYDGSDAAQSSPLDDTETSWVETSVGGDGTISFWWSVSSEQDYDKLRFLVDGEFRREITGEAGWSYVSLHIDGADAHTLRWEYTKDKASQAGSDCGWLDKVVWASGSEPLTFSQWCAAHSLSGDPETEMANDRDNDGIANAFEFAFGTNLQPQTLLLRVVSVDNQQVVEIPAQTDSTLPYINIRVVASTNLTGGESEWFLPTSPINNLDGAPQGKEWLEMLDSSTDSAFFRIEAELR